MSSNTNLGNTPVNQGYVQLIHTGETGGITTTLQSLYDGDGTASDLQIASNKVKVSTELFIGSKTLSLFIQDTVGAMFSGNTETNISVTYQTSDNTIDLVATGAITGLTGGTGLDISGSGNLTVAIDSTVATQSYVNTQVANIVDSAPSTLDTLNELAAALGDDPNFATTTATNIGTKLAKASNLSDLANVATARTNLGVDAAGTDNSTDVTLAGSLDYLTLSGQQITRNAINLGTDVTSQLPIANGGTGATNVTTARENLGLEIGLDVQAYDAGLLSISGLTTSANKMIYTTASDTYAVTSLTSSARDLLADGVNFRSNFRLSTDASNDADSASDSGIYRIDTGYSNLPSMNYGTLVTFNNKSDTGFQIAADYHAGGGSLQWRAGNSSTFGGVGSNTNWFKIWNEDNDGANSRLDADLLDGVQGSSYVQTSRSITPVSNRGISGGGDLSADRTIELSASQLGSGTLNTSDQLILFDANDSDIPKKFTAQDIFDTISGAVTIYSNTGDNRVLTSGGGTTINGEQYLTFNGTSFEVENSSNGRGVQLNTNSEIKSLDGASWLHLQRYVDGNVAVGSNSNADLYVANQLGIGTSSPSASLHINTTNDGSVYFTRDGGSAFSIEHDTSQLYFYNRTIGEAVFLMSHSGPVVINQGGDDAVDFRVEGDTNTHLLFTDASEDKVGIGTISGGSTTMMQERLSVYNNANSNVLGLIGVGSSADTNFANINFRNLYSSATGASARIGVDTGNTTDKGQLVFSTSGGSMNVAERMRIDESGNVGIGVASPSTKMHIQGSAISGSSSDANSLLTLTNNANNSIQINSSSSSAGQIRFGHNSSNYRGALTYYHSTNILGFTTSGTERVRIDTTGAKFSENFGSTDDVLHINPDNGGNRTMTINGEKINVTYTNSGGAGPALVLQENGGNVGINDASPGHKLDVNGDINTTGSYLMDDSVLIDTNKRIKNLGLSIGGDIDNSVHLVDFATPTTPGATGWYTICKANSVNARGGGVINISVTGGSMTPTALTIDFMFDWSGNLNRCITQGHSGQLTKVRAIETASTTELQIYVNTTASQSVYVSLEQDRYNPSFSLLDPWATATPVTTQQEINLNGFAIGLGGSGMTATMPTGSFGIGTNTPAYSLDISGTTRNYWYGSAISRTESTAGGYGAYKRLITTTNAYDLVSLNGDFLIDEQGVATRFIIKDTTGHVGLNEASPSTELHLGTCPDGRAITFDQSGRFNGIGNYFSSNASDSQLWFHLSTGGTDGGENVRMKVYADGRLQLVNSDNNGMLLAKATRMGYSSSYKALIIGETSGTYTTAFGYDPSTNASSSFTGDGREIIFRNGVEFTTPNSANNGFHNDILVLKDGNVGIATSTPGRPLVVNGSSDTFLSIVSGATGDGGILFGDSGQDFDGQIRYNNSSHFMFFKTNNVERMRLLNTGALHLTNDVVAFSSTPSDQKLKTNVKDIEYGLDTIMKLKPKQYDWKKDDRHDIGFIAQEVEEVIPEIVKDNEWFDDKIKTMDYEKLTAVLIKAVQEQQQQIEELKEKLNG